MSELPPEAGLAWSGMADDVLAALSSDGFPMGPLHGIGHSMGGAALVLAAARRPDAFRSLWLYEPVISPDGGRAAATKATTPCPKGRPGVVTASTRWTRPMRITGQSRRSTNFIPMLSGLMSMAASRPLRTARSRCAAGRRPKPRSFVRPRRAIRGAPRGTRDTGGHCRWPPRRGWAGSLRAGHRRRSPTGHSLRATPPRPLWAPRRSGRHGRRRVGLGPGPPVTPSRGGAVTEFDSNLAMNGASGWRWESQVDRRFSPTLLPWWDDGHRIGTASGTRGNEERGHLWIARTA